MHLSGNARGMLSAHKRSTGVALSLLCVSSLTFMSCTSSKTVSKDVAITSCKASPSGGHPKAEGTITNHSSKDSGYTIHVNFKDSSGNDVGDGVAVVAKVDKGASAKWDATGTVNAKGPVKCDLGKLARTAVP